MTLSQVIPWLYHLLPPLFGMLFAAIGLASKYPTTLKYVSRSCWAWGYLIFSSVGAWLVTQILRVVGTKVIEEDFLNSILLSLLGAGSFLGILSRVSFSGAIDSETSSQLKTLRNYIYGFLDDSISRQVMQIVESKIKVFQEPSDKERFLREANRLLGGTELSDDEKKQLRIQFDEYADHGEYVSIIRELIKHYDVDYIINELTEDISEEAENQAIRQ